MLLCNTLYMIRFVWCLLYNTQDALWNSIVLKCSFSNILFVLEYLLYLFNCKLDLWQCKCRGCIWNWWNWQEALGIVQVLCQLPCVTIVSAHWDPQTPPKLLNLKRRKLNQGDFFCVMISFCERISPQFRKNSTVLQFVKKISHSFIFLVPTTSTLSVLAQVPHPNKHYTWTFCYYKGWLIHIGKM